MLTTVCRKSCCTAVMELPTLTHRIGSMPWCKAVHMSDGKAAFVDGAYLSEVRQGLNSGDRPDYLLPRWRWQGSAMWRQQTRTTSTWAPIPWALGIIPFIGFWPIHLLVARDCASSCAGCRSAPELVGRDGHTGRSGRGGRGVGEAVHCTHWFRSRPRTIKGPSSFPGLEPKSTRRKQCRCWRHCCRLVSWFETAIGTPQGASCSVHWHRATTAVTKCRQGRQPVSVFSSGSGETTT